MGLHPVQILLRNQCQITFLFNSQNSTVCNRVKSNESMASDMDAGCEISEPSAKRQRFKDDDDIVSSTISAVKAANKHSLDSDEDEDEGATGSKYDLDGEDGVEGEEDTGVTCDGDIKLTPFNMKDEMSEGHFDRDGNYFWNKETQIRDAWLDNLDEGQVPVTERGNHDDENDDKDDDDDDDLPMAAHMKPDEKSSIYQQMLEMMKPKESVAKALRRLGGNRSGTSASARWRQKKQSTAECAELAESRRLVERLTGLANQLLTAGNMEVYQLTYEAITHQLQVMCGKNGANGSNPSSDMFGDDFDETKADELGANDAANDAERSSAETWEYCSDGEDESATLQGPLTARQLLKRKEDGKISEKAVVRRSGTENFYSARRVDFELYID